MEDRQAVEAFVGGAERVFGETVHVEDGVLIFDGYWHICMRIDERTFIVRAEETRSETDVPAIIADVLRAKGLSHVATDLPGLTVLTMQQASLGYVSWDVWSTDLATGTAAVEKAVNADSFLETSTWTEPEYDADYTNEYHGARRLAGLPTSLVLTVGVADDDMAKLGVALEDCHFITRKLGDIDAQECCSLIPTLVLVNASDQNGREFAMQVREAACGRVIPLVALTADGSIPLGADVALVAGSDPTSWVAPIRALLP